MQLGRQVGPTTLRRFSSTLRSSCCVVLSLLLAPGLGECAAENAVAILRLRVIEGDAAVYPTGARIVHPVSIQVTDETGRPVEGASVSFLLPADGPSGMFNGNMRTDIVTTGPDGRASAGPIQWNRTPGAVSIRLTVSKSEVRAGALVAQYLTDSPTAAVRSQASARSRWFTTGLIIAGAGAGAFAVALVRSPGSAAAAASGTPPAATPVSIGTPSISVGRP
jgi:hypothetical protein